MKAIGLVETKGLIGLVAATDADHGEFRGLGVYVHATFLILIGRDLPSGMRLDKQVMASHPGAKEADYARMQVQNIVNAVVPKQELLDAQIELARAHLEHDGPPDAGRVSVGPLASALST